MKYKDKYKELLEAVVLFLQADDLLKNDTHDRYEVIDGKIFEYEEGRAIDTIWDECNNRLHILTKGY